MKYQQHTQSAPILALLINPIQRENYKFNKTSTEDFPLLSILLKLVMINKARYIGKQISSSITWENLRNAKQPTIEGEETWAARWVPQEEADKIIWNHHHSWSK